jgi:hypothetical protein
MLGHVSTDFSRSVDDIENSIWHACLLVNLCQILSMEGCKFGGFIDHAIAGGEAWSTLPKSNLDWIVPGSNTRADTEWFLGGIHPRAWTEGEGLSIQTAGGNKRGIILKYVSASNDVDSAGFRKRFAGVQGFDTG